MQLPEAPGPLGEGVSVLGTRGRVTSNKRRGRWQHVLLEAFPARRQRSDWVSILKLLELCSFLKSQVHVALVQFCIAVGPFPSLSLPLPWACLNSVAASIGQLGTSLVLEAERSVTKHQVSILVSPQPPPSRKHLSNINKASPFSEAPLITCTIPHPTSQRMSSHLGSA